MEFTGHITGGHNKYTKFVADSLFDPMYNFDPEKKLVDLHMFDRASVCRKAKNIEGCLSHSVMYCWIIAYL